MFMSSTLQASVFMVKNYSDDWHFIKNSKDLTMKQMFDISEKLVSEQSDEIYGVKAISLENSSWKYLSMIGDGQVISVLHTKVYVFSDSVLCLGEIHENPRANTAWEESLAWFKSAPKYRALDRIDGEPMEFEWNIFPGFTTLQLSHNVQELLLRLSVRPENFTGRIIFMSMFNDISWGSKDNKKECESSAQLVSLYEKRFGAGHAPAWPNATLQEVIHRTNAHRCTGVKHDAIRVMLVPDGCRIEKPNVGHLARRCPDHRDARRPAGRVHLVSS